MDTGEQLEKLRETLERLAGEMLALLLTAQRAATGAAGERLDTGP